MGEEYNITLPNFLERFENLQYNQPSQYNTHPIKLYTTNFTTIFPGQNWKDVATMRFTSPIKTVPKTAPSSKFYTYRELNQDFNSIKDTKQLAEALRQIKPEQVEINGINTSSAKDGIPQPMPTIQTPSIFQKGLQKVNKFMNSRGAQIGMQALNVGMNFLGDNDKDINSWDATTKQLRGGIENSLISSGNPWLMAVGLASKGFGKLGMYGDATKGLGAGNDIINTIGSFIPGVGWFAGKSKEIQKDEQVQASTGYTGVTNDVNKAAQNAGGRFLAGMGKQNARRDRAQLAQEQAHEVLEDNKLALQNSGNPLYQLKTQVLTSGGYNAMSAKNGAKLYNLQEAKRILSNRLQSFKQGGAVNVIPDGALHKNRHHLEDIDEKFEDVTTKGIPVITEAKNGDIIQQAEVEKEEIIFNLEVTKKLEELMEKGTDEAAIEAGKLLTEEILRNTIDNTKKLL